MMRGREGNAHRGVREGKSRTQSLGLRSLRFRTKQGIKVMRTKDKGDKKNRFR
jgi:hypothetical protein